MNNPSFKVGIIGLGFIGRVHAHSYHAIPLVYPHPQVTAVISVLLRTKRDGDEELIHSLGNPLVTTDIGEFNTQELDIVDICSPNSLHLEQIRAVIRENRHLYCEKPLGLNLAHARQITQTVKDAGVLTHTTFMMRYYPAVRHAKAILESDALGQITNFRAHLFHNSYMDPSRPISWRLQKSMAGGGALADLGIHMIDLTRYLMGEVDWVQCHTDTFIKERPESADSTRMASVDVDDWGICLLGLRNGARGVIETTRISGGVGTRTQMEIFGSQGSLEIDLDQPLQVKWYDQKRGLMGTGNLDFLTPSGERPIETIWPPAKTSLGFFRDAHLACIYDFLLNIREGKTSGVNFADALQSQEVLEAAYISADQNGKIIHLPLP